MPGLTQSLACSKCSVNVGGAVGLIPPPKHKRKTLLLYVRVTRNAIPRPRGEPESLRSGFINRTSQPDQHHLRDRWHPWVSHEEPRPWAQVRKGASVFPGQEDISLQLSHRGPGAQGGGRGATLPVARFPGGEQRLRAAAGPGQTWSLLGSGNSGSRGGAECTMAP